MTTSSKRYKIVNTTVKKPRLHPKTGEDLRPTVEKVGHNVAFRSDTNERIEVERHRPRIVSHVNEGMLRLQRGGFIRIEEIDDVTSVLQKHTLDGKKPDLLAPDENARLDDIVAHPSAERVARAVKMGEDDYKQKSGKETEGAINPDGDPNFVVRANKNMKRKQRTAESSSEPEMAPPA